MFQTEIVSHSRGNIEACAPIQIGFWAFISKHILPMVRSEWSRVFPLRISNSIAFADRDPSIFASGNSRALVCLFEPRNNARRFRSVACTGLVVVGQRAVKWGLARCKFHRDIIPPMGRIRVIKTAVVFCPSSVPGARPIRYKIISARSFADPKDCCYDTCFPRIPLRSSRGRRFFDEGLAFFSDRFDLSKGWIVCDEEGETKKPK